MPLAIEIREVPKALNPEANSEMDGRLRVPNLALISE
jgi:hypothetical protein